ncbi:F0F1 ATP synthase subunit epsilon [Dyella sp. KRB-257]|uniref:F0F1 ATP synthase subunit epsilon n=1 Tax=Dyella sp. KRB-257 TaxID=3400915 RepID=UPI003C092A1D
MNRHLHLVLATPQQVVLDLDDVGAVRGEDASGSFGILPGHADLVTVLVPTVLRWQRAGGEKGFCALRGGVLRMSDGKELHVACRGAVHGDDLDTLETTVRTARADQADADRRARVEQMQLHARAVRTLLRYLRPGPRNVAP